MKKYSKLIAAAVGLMVIVAVDFFGWAGDATATANSILGLLTAVGVYAAPANQS